MNQRSGRRVALVTGGRRGIGLAIAEALAAGGLDVAITGTRDDQVARAAVNKLSAHGASATFVAGDVGNVDDHARVLDVVEIFDRVRQRVPASLVMVGDGPERGPAEHLARELKVERHISFLGKQDHVERLIPLTHVLLMPSELEGFGLVALEAMACGVVPVCLRKNRAKCDGSANASSLAMSWIGCVVNTS